MQPEMFSVALSRFRSFLSDSEGLKSTAGPGSVGTLVFMGNDYFWMFAGPKVSAALSNH